MCRYLIERFLDIRATENTAAMSMLDCPHHPHRSVCLYTNRPSIQSRCLMISIAFTEPFVCTITHIRRAAKGSMQE